MKNNASLFVAAGALALSGLFLVFRPREDVTVRPPQDRQAQTFDLVVEQGQLVSGPTVVSLRRGDRIVLRITSDHDDDLHLHGYDLHLSLKAGVPATLEFTADKSGRFEYELHHANLELGALEVQPE